MAYVGERPPRERWPFKVIEVNGREWYCFAFESAWSRGHLGARIYRNAGPDQWEFAEVIESVRNVRNHPTPRAVS